MESVPVSLWRSRWNLFQRNRLAVIAALGLLLMAVVSLLAPAINAVVLHASPDAIDSLSRYSRPTSRHVLGTDGLGRDELARLLDGSRVTLSIGLLIVVVSAALGLAIGLVSGFSGRLADGILMRLTDTVLAVPSFFLILAVVSVSKVTVLNLVIVIGITRWMEIARLIRADVLSLKNREYVLAARSLGASDARLLLRHVLPGVLPTLIVAGSLQVGYGVLIESGLSFLGVGVPAPQASWGSLLSTAQGDIWVSPLLAVYPGLAIMAAVLAFNFVGDGLREALAPRLEQA